MAFKEGSEHPHFQRTPLPEAGVLFQFPLSRFSRPETDVISHLTQFDQRHILPGVADALTTYPWIDGMLVEFSEHFPEGAIDSVRVARMGYNYAKARPDEYDDMRTMTLTAAALLHDIGKLRVPKSDLESTEVYKPEVRLQKMARHVEEGVRMVIGQEDSDPIDYTGVDKELVRIALILGGHHLEQDDRGSFPPADVSWLQTGDLTILQDRKVLQVADRVEAQRSERSYKRAFTEEETKGNLLNQGQDLDHINFMLAQYASLTEEQLAA